MAEAVGQVVMLGAAAQLVKPNDIVIIFSFAFLTPDEARKFKPEVVVLDEKNKKYQPVDITMENRQNNRSSRFVTEKIVFNPKVKDDYFTTDYLEK